MRYFSRELLPTCNFYLKSIISFLVMVCIHKVPTNLHLTSFSGVMLPLWAYIRSCETGECHQEQWPKTAGSRVSVVS